MLAAALGTDEDAPGSPIDLAANLTLLAAKAAGVAALLVENRVADFAIFRQKAKQAAFDGIVTAQPKAIAAIRSARK